MFAENVFAVLYKRLRLNNLQSRLQVPLVMAQYICVCTYAYISMYV